MTNMAIGKLMSVSEAAAELGMTVGRVRQLLWSGELKGQQLNGEKSPWLVDKMSVLVFKRKPQVTGRPRSGAAMSDE